MSLDCWLKPKGVNFIKKISLTTHNKDHGCVFSYSASDRHLFSFRFHVLGFIKA